MDIKIINRTYFKHALIVFQICICFCIISCSTFLNPWKTYSKKEKQENEMSSGIEVGGYREQIRSGLNISPAKTNYLVEIDKQELRKQEEENRERYDETLGCHYYLMSLEKEEKPLIFQHPALVLKKKELYLYDFVKGTLQEKKLNIPPNTTVGSDVIIHSVKDFFLMIRFENQRYHFNTKECNFIASIKNYTPENSNNEIPYSLEKLNGLYNQSQENIEFQITNYEATLDLKHLGEAALSGMDSAKALKYLSLAVRLSPYIKSLVTLRDTALGIYIKTTNEMMDNSNVNCDFINERISYLRDIAPDGLTKLSRDIKVRCPNLDLNYLVSSEKEYTNLLNYLDKRNPSVDKLTEHKIFKDLTDELEFIISQNNDLKFEETLLRLLKIFGDIRIFSNEFKIATDTNNDNNFSIMMTYLSTSSSLIDYCSTVETHCSTVRDILEVRKGKHPLLCRKGDDSRDYIELRTNKSRYDWYSQFGPSLDDIIGAFKVILKYRSGKTIESSSMIRMNFKTFFSHSSSIPSIFSSCHYYGKHEQPTIKFLNNYFKVGEKNFELDINSFGQKNKIISIKNADRNLVSGLNSVEFIFDRFLTYKIYMSYYNCVLNKKCNSSFNNFLDQNLQKGIIDLK